MGYLFNFIKQHSKTATVRNYQNADCSLRKKFIGVIYCNFRRTFATYYLRRRYHRSRLQLLFGVASQSSRRELQSMVDVRDATADKPSQKLTPSAAAFFSAISSLRACLALIAVQLPSCADSRYIPASPLF